ncbi:hypothetical protein ALC53_01226 [Atta colombica]|uniref:Uncharacterized protein n=1 Tax=Atta colombica TaxID=520822 RepID=A0A195BW18_9HYME|nr:hypothetical protein ALC53_01226 [Atta colombica]
MELAKRNQRHIYVEITCQAIPAKIDKHPLQTARTSVSRYFRQRAFYFLFNKTRTCDNSAGLTKKVTPKLPNASSITATIMAESKRGSTAATVLAYHRRDILRIYPCSAVHRVDITLHSKSAWYPGIIDAGLNPGDNPDMTNHRLKVIKAPLSDMLFLNQQNEKRKHRFKMSNNKEYEEILENLNRGIKQIHDITRVFVGIHVWPTCSSVINDRIHLSEGIGRVIKFEQTLPRGIAFQKGVSRLDRCTSVKHYGSIE